MANLPADPTDRRKKSRRKYSRGLVDWPVTVISTSGSYQGKAANISRGGALIYLTEELNVGDHVRLAFEVPDFQDVIVAKGEVLRTLPLQEGDEQQFPYGIALKFTEISDENLKFFTGNLAPEWKADYVDNGPITNDIVSPNASRNKSYFPWILVIILLIPLAYFSYDSIQRKVINENSISEVESKLLIIAEQISSLETSVNSLTSLEIQLNDLHQDASDIKNRLPDKNILETIIQQIDTQNRHIEDINQKIKHIKEDNSKSSIIDRPKETEQQYYVVQKGDNLFQISSQHKISVQKLKEMNEIGPNEAIRPGQRLKIK